MTSFIPPKPATTPLQSVAGAAISGGVIPPKLPSIPPNIAATNAAETPANSGKNSSSSSTTPVSTVGFANVLQQLNSALNPGAASSGLLGIGEIVPMAQMLVIRGGFTLFFGVLVLMGIHSFSASGGSGSTVVDILETQQREKRLRDTLELQQARERRINDKEHPEPEDEPTPEPEPEPTPESEPDSGPAPEGENEPNEGPTPGSGSGGGNNGEPTSGGSPTPPKQPTRRTRKNPSTVNRSKSKRPYKARNVSKGAVTDLSEDAMAAVAL